MQAKPKSLKQVAEEARQAFDLDFNEIYADIKTRLQAAIKIDENTIDISALITQLDEIRAEREKLDADFKGGNVGLYKKNLSYLIGRAKSIRESVKALGI